MVRDAEGSSASPKWEMDTQFPSEGAVNAPRSTGHAIGLDGALALAVTGATGVMDGPEDRQDGLPSRHWPWLAEMGPCPALGDESVMSLAHEEL
jgi:hypothetical protein